MRKTFLIAAGVSAILAGQAQAHARLIQATPKVGSTVAASPKQLRLQYSESIVAKESAVTLTGPTGAAVATGPMILDAKDKRVVLAPIPGALAPGVYKVSWKMKTPDDHRTEGDFSFTVKP